jgi:Ras-related protein Rab-1A
MSLQSYDTLQKFTILGEENTGKSALLLKFKEESFPETYIPTIGVDFGIKTVLVDGSFCKLQIWDTAGQIRFRTITQSYYRGTHGFLFVFDITRRDTLVGLKDMIEEMINFGRPEVPSILVGNKADLENERQISYEEAEEFAYGFGMKYFETSAKTNANVYEIFLHLSKMVSNKIHSNLFGNWCDQYVLVTPEMWLDDVIHDSAALVVTLLM